MCEVEEHTWVDALKNIQLIDVSRCYELEDLRMGTMVYLEELWEKQCKKLKSI